MKYALPLVALVVAGCGGSSSPTSPTPTPPVVVAPPPPAPPQITNYAGRWLGTYIVEQCAGSSGSMDDVLCSAPRGSNPGGLFQRGEVFPIALDLSQNGSAIAGTLNLGGIRGAVTGSVLSNRALVLSGSAVYSDAGDGLVVTNTITHWDTSIADTFLIGTFTFNVKVNILPGDGVVRVRLSNVRR